MTRCLILSNAPWTLTGYGKQIRELALRLQAMGHDVAILGVAGLLGSSIDWRGIPVYPCREHPLGVDVVGYYARHFDADVVISLYDVWGFPENIRASLPCPWIAWTPVDGTPVSKPMLRRLHTADWQVAFSKFGQREMQSVGLDADYIPLGIDCDLFKPAPDKGVVRDQLGISRDVYLVTMVAANKGYPARKSWPEALMAFARFYQNHSNARLYLHTTPLPFGSGGAGIIFADLLEAVGLPPNVVTFVDQGAMAVGIPDEQMVAIYQASDVLLSPSMAEGFGLPIVEAQACGCPVITLDCSAMTENTLNGIVTEPVQPAWIPQLGYWWQTASVELIADALEQVYDLEMSRAMLPIRSRPLAAFEPENLPFFSMSQDAIWAINSIRESYDWPIVMAQWQRLLERVEERIAYNLTHDHKWTNIGINKGDLFCAPCATPECEAQLQRAKDGTTWSILRGFPNPNLEDVPGQGASAKITSHEIVNSYRLQDVDFAPGDVMIDIGAHVGAACIYVAKNNPGVTVYAYEPVPKLFDLLCENALAHGVSEQIRPFNLAVTSDGRDVTLQGDLDVSSGGMSTFPHTNYRTEESIDVQSVALADILDAVGHCRLLKVDCEGAEYDILQSANGLLDNVDWLVAEFHTDCGHDANELIAQCAQHIALGKLRVVKSRR